MSEVRLVELNDSIEAVKSQLRLQIEELVDVVSGDLPGYVLKAVRRAFIEDVEFAEKRTDAELADFKDRVAEFGQKLSDETRAALMADMETWWGAGVDHQLVGKTLEGNAKIWSILVEIGDKTLAFIEREGLKAIALTYATPARFIDGKYPPGMIEKYWSHLATLRGLEEELLLASEASRKTRQASRWDSI